MLNPFRLLLIEKKKIKEHVKINYKLIEKKNRFIVIFATAVYPFKAFIIFLTKNGVSVMNAI